MLKKVCLGIAQEALKPPNLFECTPHLTKLLEELLKLLNTEPKVTPTTAEYVFFPLRSLLQQEKLSDRVVELMLKCIAFLCRNVWTLGESFELERAQQLVAVTMYLISSNSALDAKLYFKKPFGYRAAAYECLDAVLNASCKSGFGFELGKSPAIAEAIMMLLACIQFDSENLEAQLSCIHALQLIFTKVIQNRDHRALVLPKVVSKLAKFINSGNKHHFRAKALAIECLGDVFTSVYNGVEIEYSSVITEEYVNNLMKNLEFTLLLVQKFQTHLFEVSGSRPELVDAVFQFSKVMYPLKLNEPSTELVMQMILASSSQKVSLETAKLANEFLLKHGKTADMEVLFTNMIESIPSLVQTPNESKAVVGLNTIKTQIELMNDYTGNAQLLLDAIEHSLPITVTRGTTKKIAGDALQANPIKQIEVYKHKSSFITLQSLGLSVDMPPHSEAALVDLMATLGTKHASFISEVLMNRVQETRATHQQPTLGTVVLLWMLSCVLRDKPQIDCYDVITYCYEEVSKTLNIQEQPIELRPASGAHTALCCFLIGQTALIEGPQFSDLLVDIIHPLFSSLGNFDSLNVRMHAQLAISKVAYACGFESPMELALANKDYLVDGISFQLSTLNMTPGTFQALASLIYISGESMIPYLDDLFATLFDLLDKYHHYTVLLKGALNVFGALIYVITQTNKLPLPIMAKPDIRFTCVDDVKAALNKKPEIDPTILESEEKVPPQPTGDSDDEDFGDEDALGEADPAEEKWEYPIAKSTYTIISNIAMYCDKLMTHSSAEIRTATLSLITPLIPYLSINRDLFLPLVHKTWPEATARAFDKEAFVVEQALKCISAICRYARDFVLARIGELWPKLVDKYRTMLARKWPQFSPERRMSNALASFLQTMIESIPHIHLETLELAFTAFRPALLRNEHLQLKDTIMNSNGADLLFLVLLETKLEQEGLPTIEPVYAN